MLAFGPVTEVSIESMRSFTRIRRVLAGQHQLAPRFSVRFLFCFAITLAVSSHLVAQLVPLADRVDPALLPSGIMEQSVSISGKLAYMFKEADGTNATHIVGDFALKVGDEPGREMKAREAVIWTSQRDFQGRPYRQLQLFLWRDAEIEESGGTVTFGPALFASLNTFSDVLTHVDDYAMQSSTESEAYREGQALRAAMEKASISPVDPNAALLVYDASGQPSGVKKREPKPAFYFQSDNTVTYGDVSGRRVATVLGGAYLSRGVSGASDFVEIQADNIVLFLSESGDPIIKGDPREQGLGGIPTDRGKEAAIAPKKKPAEQQVSSGFGELGVEAIYLEGDVRMRQGPSGIRASRLFYDSVNDRALILDAVVRTTVTERGVPVYLRADEIRQLSATHFSADKAKLTTSEFHTPHYHVGAEHIELSELVPSERGGPQGGVQSGRFYARDATLNIGGIPVGYWPSVRGTLQTSETAIRSIRTGYSGDFGAEFETDWNFFNLMNLETPEGFDSTLSLDYFSDRGPAIGIDADYERDRYFGLLRTYMIADDGTDSLGDERETPSVHDLRGRALIRHRQYLEDDWQVSLEMSYISDRSFLEEFFESEFDNDKEQETLIYLKKQRDNWAFTTQLQYRPLDFTTQTERFPDLGYFRNGEPIGGFATWYGEYRAGFVRYRPADPTFRELLRDGGKDGSGTTARLATRNEFTAPFDLGNAKLVPFVASRSGIWDDSPEDGGIGRFFGEYGVRGSSYLWRVYPDVRSQLFDVDGVRHVIKPDITAWGSHTNVDSHELYPFDETVEQIDEIDGVTVGVRQRWQTKRGEGMNRRSVDLFTLDIESGAFNDATGEQTTNGFTSFSRPENSIARNFISGATIWRVNDRTALLSETNFDLNDGDIDIFNIALAVERTPRFGYLVGYRYIGDTESNLLGLETNYRLTEKHTLALREQFDIDRGKTLEFTIALIRRFPRWYSALSFDLDNAEDDFGISLSVWPEGLPQAALGSKRFTGLAQSTRVGNN